MRVKGKVLKETRVNYQEIDPSVKLPHQKAISLLVEEIEDQNVFLFTKPPFMPVIRVMNFSKNDCERGVRTGKTIYSADIQQIKGDIYQPIDL